MTPFGLTFSQHFGALTSVWVVPLSVRELTPRNPFPGVYGADEFGVRKESGIFRSLTSQSVLYPTSPRSGERIARQHPFGPPPGFRLASPCPGLDRPVSSFTAVTPSPFRLRASPARRLAARMLVSLRLRAFKALKLATAVNSPARVSRRNVQPWSPSLVLLCRHRFLWEGSILPGCTRL